MKTYEEIASAMMYGGVTVPQVLEHFEFRTRKGKVLGVEDLHHAARKALKNGMQKVEFEESMLALYLKDVLKKRRK